MENKKLPIARFRRQIVEAVNDHSVVIITAETGAGKSTQVPQYLLSEGYDLVVTQPRRLAARTVAARVAEEIGQELGGLVGYRTAVDRQDSPATRCLFCTDGLALVRELMGQNKGVLVLDEVHEWNENMEVLVAWSKRQIEAGVAFKVVLMSATMEAEKLSAFFNGAPVISVPGRMFPVEERRAGEKLIDDIVALVREGRNILVFLPGKQEIEDICSALLVTEQFNAEVLPLHGQLAPSEQARCFKHYGRPKVVVSTNVAQTSVTIDDIDAVVDSGLERRVELVDGVEGLYLKPISLADTRQRKGRAGRTKAGIYIDHCPVSFRPDFPVAEIMRKRLDQTVLRLAITGFDMELLEFFHQPAMSEIQDAKRALKALGCMTTDGQITKIGRLVNRLPISVQYGRMLAEADRLGVVDDVLTVAAILEQGGITVPPPSRNQPDRPDWRAMVPDEHESDIMGQLSVWQMAENMTKDQMRKDGISLRSYFRAREIRDHLAQAVRKFFHLGSTGRREDILKAVSAGMVDHLYQGRYGEYQNGDGQTRQLGTASLVRGAEWLVGLPFDLEIQTRRGKMTLHLITLATKVNPEWLAEVAPHLTEQKTGLDPRYDAQKDTVVSTTQVFFNGQMVREETVADGDHPEAAEVFARWLAGCSSTSHASLDAVLGSNAARQNRARQLNNRSGENTFKVYSSDEIFQWFVTALSGARRIAEIIRPEALALPLLDEKAVDRVLSENPDTIRLLGEDLAVEYNIPLRVRLYQEIIASNRWLSLPDEGVRLPGGRLVEIVASFGFYDSIADSNVPHFKEKMRQRLNQEQWNKWEKPEIAIPNPEDENSHIPVITACYGKCVVTGKKLLAYGTLMVNRSHWYSSDPWFKPLWSQSQEEAERARAEAQQKLEEIRVEARQKRELETAKSRLQELLANLQDLNGHEKWFVIHPDTRQDVENHLNGYLPTANPAISEWISLAESLITQAKRDIKEFEIEREIARQAGCPENVVIWRRRSGLTNAGDGWVIRPDGQLRRPDEMECPRPRYSDEGYQTWRIIRSEELVIKWSKDCTSAPHQFEIVWRPETITPEQLNAVRSIEDELQRDWEGAVGVSGATSPPIGNGWGLSVPDPQVSVPATPSSLAALAAKFGKKKK